MCLLQERYPTERLEITVSLDDSTVRVNRIGKKNAGIFLAPGFCSVLDGHIGVEFLEHLWIWMFLQQAENHHENGCNDEAR